MGKSTSRTTRASSSCQFHFNIAKRSHSPKMARLSGLQKEVLVLYRNCLREARKKPEVRSRRRGPLPPTLVKQCVGSTDISRRRVENISKPSRGWSYFLYRKGTRFFQADLSLRTEFEKNLAVEKRDFAAIEFLLRKGRRQLDSYSAPGIKDIK